MRVNISEPEICHMSPVGELTSNLSVLIRDRRDQDILSSGEHPIAADRGVSWGRNFHQAHLHNDLPDDKGNPS